MSMDRKVNDLKSLVLRLASPQVIRSWSHGEVMKPETINYRTQRPERDGLFCEKIFGPTKDFECYCGKYRRVRYKGITCDKCGVEVTRSLVRRERMGHIELAAPVAHIWFVRSVPSRLGTLLDLSIVDLERVIYFAGYIITSVDEGARKEALKSIEQEYKSKQKTVTDKATLRTAAERAKSELKNLTMHTVLSEVEYHRLSIKYGTVFKAETGAEALKRIVEAFDFPSMILNLEGEAALASPANRKKLVTRLRLAKSLAKSNIRPDWMFLSVLPVIPPDLRPMVPLDGGRHASSDVNDLYRRVINRNNRLKRLYELHAPEVITRNEKRMLQEAVDALIDNSMRRSTSPVSSQAQRRPLRSLADMLKGKQGRFRQNLLGKRVDYSGRSVIVVGPTLKMHQCGLPKHMALELFRPFVIQKIIEREYAHNIRGSGKLIDDATPEVWAILEEVIKGKYVLLNRAPTLHRLGIQAFQPLLIEGNAIQLHPMVCSAFNADFDGDQMAVHVPLTEEAQKEAREIMASSKNLLKPSTGESISAPTLDIVLGIYWLTSLKEDGKGVGKIFSSKNETVLSYDLGDLDLRAPVKILTRSGDKVETLETSVGRIYFNAALPNDFPFVNEVLDKKKLGALMDTLFRTYGPDPIPGILDKVKDIGYQYATKSGVSWGMDDLVVPPAKSDMIDRGLKKVSEIQDQYDNGLLTDDERYTKVIEVWSAVTKEVTDAVPMSLNKTGSVYQLVTSGARGSWGSITQMAGIKGLMRNPSGRIIELPIISSYKEGLSVFEYFISTHGARKGTADTALKTAVAGYLTRRLVDVAHDVVVTEEDCGVTEGLTVRRSDLEQEGVSMRKRLVGRILAEGVKSEDGSVAFKKGHLLSHEEAAALDEAGIKAVVLRSPVYCGARRGICQTCYGYDLGHNRPVEMGAAVGIVAAQAIGEPGTQLTMRTFHSGGAVGAGGSDITLGLPRVEEVFEARMPKGVAVISEIDGEVLDIVEDDKEKTIHILPKGGGKKSKGEVEEFHIPFGRTVTVKKGDTVAAGDLLCEGPIDLKQLFEVAGKTKAVNYILTEIVKMYALQGASISQKHVEVMIRQMFSRVKIIKPNDSSFAEGEIVDKLSLATENRQFIKEGKVSAEAVEMLSGITKVAITTPSFLSAASFQETSKVLIRAALESREDKLVGLKENVIIGRLIPAGTGFASHQERRAAEEAEEAA